MKLALILLGMGIGANLAMLMFLKHGTWRIARLFDNRGEAGTTETTDSAKTIMMTQEQVDKIVQTRLTREREKYADYETIKQKVAEYEKLNSEKAQKDLEAGKQYEEAKKTYEGKIKSYEEKLSEKDRSIADMMISNTLTSAISSQNAHIEESIALLKSSAKIVDGVVKISAKDANGIEQLLPAEEGVKRFLTARPHLVKSNARSGSGTGSGSGDGSGTGAGGNAVEDLNSLNLQMQHAINTRDVRKQVELKTKMKALMHARGVNI